MTRVEWVASLDEDVRNKFIANITEDNGAGFIDYWMKSSEKNGDRVHGIGGAFVWNKTKEGHEYWSRINTNMLEA